MSERPALHYFLTLMATLHTLSGERVSMSPLASVDVPTKNKNVSCWALRPGNREPALHSRSPKLPVCTYRGTWSHHGGNLARFMSNFNHPNVNTSYCIAHLLNKKLDSLPWVLCERAILSVLMTAAFSNCFVLLYTSPTENMTPYSQLTTSPRAESCSKTNLALAAPNALAQTSSSSRAPAGARTTGSGQQAAHT